MLPQLIQPPIEISTDNVTQRMEIEMVPNRAYGFQQPSEDTTDGTPVYDYIIDQWPDLQSHCASVNWRAGASQPSRTVGTVGRTGAHRTYAHARNLCETPTRHVSLWAKSKARSAAWDWRRVADACVQRRARDTCTSKEEASAYRDRRRERDTPAPALC